MANTCAGCAQVSIGHTEGSAGVMGMIKAITGLRECAVTPNLHLRQLNPNCSSGLQRSDAGVVGGDQALRSMVTLLVGSARSERPGPMRICVRSMFIAGGRTKVT